MKTLITLAVLLVASSAQAQFFQYSNLTYSLPAGDFVGTEMNALYVTFNPLATNDPASASVTFGQSKPFGLQIFITAIGVASNPTSIRVHDNEANIDLFTIMANNGITQNFTDTFTPPSGETFTLTASSAGGPSSLNAQFLAVPEPASWVLLALGMAAGIFQTCQRSSRASIVDPGANGGCHFWQTRPIGGKF